MNNASARTIPAERIRIHAENLARLAHFRGLDLPEAAELDFVAWHLLAAVGDSIDQAAVWLLLQDDCRALWHLITDGWDADDLDEISEDDWARHSFATQQQEIDHRYTATRERLCHDIEHAVAVAAERCAARTAVA